MYIHAITIVNDLRQTTNPQVWRRSWSRKCVFFVSEWRMTFPRRPHPITALCWLQSIQISNLPDWSNARSICARNKSKKVAERLANCDQRATFQTGWSNFAVCSRNWATVVINPSTNSTCFLFACLPPSHCRWQTFHSVRWPIFAAKFIISIGVAGGGNKRCIII